MNIFMKTIFKCSFKNLYFLNVYFMVTKFTISIIIIIIRNENNIKNKKQN